MAETKGVSNAVKLHNIAIDMELHKLIESARENFSEEPHEILKRIFAASKSRVDENKVAATAAKREETKAATPVKEQPRQIFTARGRQWSSDGVFIPHGSEARLRYQRGKQVIEGHFLDGLLVVDGKKYETLSEAANGVALTRGGKKTRLNGWAYWEVKRPGDERFILMDDLRHGPAVKAAKATRPQAAEPATRPVHRVKAGRTPAEQEQRA